MSDLHQRVLRSPSATARMLTDQATAELRRTTSLLHTGRVEGPAEAYLLTGSLTELSAALDQCLGELAHWWDEPARRTTLRAVEGPFAGDPAAAAQVASDSLTSARAACAELAAALERAQMATADLEALREQSISRPRRWWQR